MNVGFVKPKNGMAHTVARPPFGGDAGPKWLLIQRFTENPRGGGLSSDSEQRLRHASPAASASPRKDTLKMIFAEPAASMDRSSAVFPVKEETDHFRGGMGAVGVGVAAGRVAAEPGMTAAVHDPRLGQHRAVGVGVHGAGM